MLRKRIGVKERTFIKEFINTMHIGGVVRLVKHIIIGTVILEGLGIIVLFIKFSSEMGLKQVYLMVFSIQYLHFLMQVLI